jgi:hypothetical protein
MFRPLALEVTLGVGLRAASRAPRAVEEAAIGMAVVVGGEDIEGLISGLGGGIELLSVGGSTWEAEEGCCGS